LSRYGAGARPLRATARNTPSRFTIVSRISKSRPLSSVATRDFPAGAAPSFAFPLAAKIRFFYFNLATENHVGALFKVVSGDLMQAVKIVGLGIAVSANQGAAQGSRRAGHKMLR